MLSHRLHTVNSRYHALPCLALLLACSTNAFAAADAYRVADRQVLAGPVRWDYLSVDSARHHLFLTRGDQVDVYDTATKQITGSIANTKGVHGVAVAQEQERGYTSNGASDSVTVFSLATLDAITTVPVGAKPDAIIYDAHSARVFVANGKGASLSVIAAPTNKVIGTIALGGQPETAVVDGKGRLYIAIENKNAVAVIDTDSLKVLRQIDVASVCDEPAGLAIDVEAAHLFVGCHNKTMTVLDAVTGKILASPHIGAGNDAVAFDPERKLAFASNGEGSLTVVDGTAPYAVRQTLVTMPRARTMALDPATHAIYLTSADVAHDGPPLPAGARPTLKAGSFVVLTVTAP
ncbi:MAG: hypothetical protein ACJ8GW_11805 [Massilia sp.]